MWTMLTRMPEKLRRDAALNRERLLDAARELFATRGLDVSLNDIAHHAGVGVGTAYRRFANKQAVMEALFEDVLDDLAEVARTSLREPDAWVGLVGFLERSLELQFGDRGINAIMNHPALGDERVDEARTRIAPLIQELVDRAKAQGLVRTDLEQSDVVFVQVGLSAILGRTRGVEPELYRRYLAIFLDGIRADRSLTPLPVGALDSTCTHRAMTAGRSPEPPADSAP